MRWETHHGTQAWKPLEIEITPTAVYVRQNIEAEKTTSTDGKTVPGWKYEEAKLTPEEYSDYVRDTTGAMAESMAQQYNDLAASMEMSDITAEGNHKEQMQLLNDIQADIQMNAVTAGEA